MPQPLPRIAVAPAENRPYRVAMPRTSKRPLPRHVLRIGERRRELGLTQEELARMAGFSTSLMAKIERGAVDPKTLSAQYLVGLARALGLTLSEVMGEEVPGDDLGFVPFTLPVYTSPEELEEGKPASRAFLAPAELPRGAVVERLAFLEVPGGGSPPWTSPSPPPGGPGSSPSSGLSSNPRPSTWGRPRATPPSSPTRPWRGILWPSTPSTRTSPPSGSRRSAPRSWAWYGDGGCYRGHVLPKWVVYANL